MKIRYKRLEFWESEETKPKSIKPRRSTVNQLDIHYRANLAKIKRRPYSSVDIIREFQWKRIQELVNYAYDSVPFYKKHYGKVGFEPGDLKCWEDFFNLPLVYKEQLIEAGLEKTTSVRFNQDDIFHTRSSGSSGKVLRISVNKDAIIEDTIQGIRQFWLQSNNKYNWNHLLTHVYTVPWWFSSIKGRYETAFISSLIEAEKIVSILNNLNTHILSCYPSNLESILTVSDKLSEKLYLTVVHSEMSSKEQRRFFSKKLSVPVLDEYSSEELTRIALELPCGHYHVHEDSVFLEVLDEDNLKHIKSDETGLAVGTNLLNKAMPFIRYVQGDYITLPKSKSDCEINWSQIESIEGRLNDSFLKRDGSFVPAGTLLDVSYRWMFDSGVQPYRFEMIQKSYDVVEINLVAVGLNQKSKNALEDKIKKHMSILLGEDCLIKVNQVSDIKIYKGRKFRPIKRAF